MTTSLETIHVGDMLKIGMEGEKAKRKRERHAKYFRYFTS